MQGNEAYIVLAVAIVALFFVFFKRDKRPPTESFSCARCKKQELYSVRTVEAWRRGFNKIYCGACHKIWLDRNPHRNKQNYSVGKANGGCLGILVVAVLAPPTIYGVVQYIS